MHLRANQFKAATSLTLPRAQELCESRGSRKRGLPVPNSTCHWVSVDLKHRERRMTKSRCTETALCMSGRFLHWLGPARPTTGPQFHWPTFSRINRQDKFITSVKFWRMTTRKFSQNFKLRFWIQYWVCRTEWLCYIIRFLLLLVEWTSKQCAKSSVTRDINRMHWVSVNTYGFNRWTWPHHLKVTLTRR